MSERYDAAAARHYAAYRPPLHGLILERALPPGARYDVGVDVGCGAGASSHALAAHCESVWGVDPSPSMLARARPHGRVSYAPGTAEALPLPDRTADVVTFAGSLFYADAEAAAREVRRVGRPGAAVVVYDFDVLLSDAVRALGVDAAGVAADYDHSVNLSGRAGLAERSVVAERVVVGVTADELAHVVLSDSGRLDRLVERFGEADPFRSVRDTLLGVGAGGVAADLYYAVYEVA